MHTTLKGLSYGAVVLMTTCAIAGCAIVPRPFGYLQVWGDRNSYGDPSLYFERVRTDGPSGRASPPTVSASQPTEALPPEQTRTPTPAESVAAAQTPFGTWLFQ